jgi:hypothetical protein
MSKVRKYVFIDNREKYGRYFTREENLKIKKLDFDGKELLYRKTFGGNGHDYSYPTTTFYVMDGKRELTEWNWRKFRRVGTGIMVDRYVATFSLNFWIKEIEYTKADIRERVERNMELHERPEELRKGEIV